MSARPLNWLRKIKMTVVHRYKPESESGEWCMNEEVSGVHTRVPIDDKHTRVHSVLEYTCTGTANQYCNIAIHDM